MCSVIVLDLVFFLALPCFSLMCRNAKPFLMWHETLTLVIPVVKETALGI